MSYSALQPLGLAQSPGIGVGKATFGIAVAGSLRADAGRPNSEVDRQLRRNNPRLVQQAMLVIMSHANRVCRAWRLHAREAELARPIYACFRRDVH